MQPSISPGLNGLERGIVASYVPVYALCSKAEASNGLFIGEEVS